MREIGSEFWNRYETEKIEQKENEAYLLSGRTALQFIIDDISEKHRVKKALLPDYCCESMILPFIRSGISVDFYRVNSEGYDYPFQNDADIILLVDFFGYEMHQNIEIAEKSKASGKVVIYDSTHTINGNYSVQQYANYSFCSYRKWFYCNFAKVIKHNGKFYAKALKNNDSYTDLRDRAAEFKKMYILGLNDSKVFLGEFNAAEQLLESDFSDYAGMPVKFEIEEIRRKRRENAQFLMNSLKNNRAVKLWREELSANDIPLFVPILVDPNVRNELRKKLINESIYCPIHWPKSHLCDSENELYEMEISLICDQRYNASDMGRIISVINEFFDS